MKATRTYERKYDRDAVLAYIRSFTQSHGYAPCMREIKEAFQISGISVVVYILWNLERDGKIRRDLGVARSIQVLEEA